MATVFGNVVTFFEKIGVYEVVLPFIFVFTVMYAILEKTRVFGSEKVKGESYTKKNVNALVAFCVAFFVIASSQLVEIITTVSAQVVILLMVSIFFLLLVGSFHKEGAIDLEDKTGWKAIFMIIMFVGVLLIFLQAIKLPNGQSWLEFGLYWLTRNISSGFVASIIMLAGLVFFIIFITQPSHIGQADDKK